MFLTRFCVTAGAVAGLLELTLGMGFSQSQPQPPALAQPMPDVLRNYQPVTAERLGNPEDGNWLSIRRTYDGWGYSPLDQITADNVKSLRPVWIFSTGETKVHESAPLVNNGVMFVSTPNNQVIAIDVRTGNLLWRYKRPRPAGAVVAHDTSRGVALYGDKVYFAAGEAVLVALDARTGKEVWTTQVADSKAAYYITLAPLIAGGKVMVGASGGEFGIRGFVAAFDPETGKEQWRTYTIPAPGEPGSETWPKGDQWKTGGGSVWVTGNYDPATNLAYWGVGNGGPWMGDTAARRQSLRLLHDRIGCRHRRDQRLFPIQSERLVGLGRSLTADPGRLPARRTHLQRTDRCRARRLHVVPRSRRFDDGRTHQIYRRQALRLPERVPQPRSGDRAAGRRSGAQARHGKAGRLLPGIAWRQELAAHCLQSEDAHDLYSGQ